MDSRSWAYRKQPKVVSMLPELSGKDETHSHQQVVFLSKVFSLLNRRIIKYVDSGRDLARTKFSHEPIDRSSYALLDRCGRNPALGLGVAY